MQIRKFRNSSAVWVAAVSALAPLSAFAAQSSNTNAAPVQQGQTGGVNNPAETISFEGQGSLNKIIATAAFGYVNLTGPLGTPTFTLNNGVNGAPVTYSDTSTSTSAFLNLASSDFTAADTGVGSPSTIQQTNSALRLEWHWNGTTDGSNDLINDQIGYNQATGSVSPQQGANRGPSIANPVYINTQKGFNGSGGNASNITTIAGFSLNNSGGLSVYNTYSAANYNQAGNNLLGGTNRVQFSFSDYKTVDYSVPGTPSAFSAPGSAGYGNGNPAIPAATNNLLGIGVNGARESYQPSSIANMPTSNINPGTVSTANPGGTAYASGPWNTAGLDNINSTAVAANAVLIAANPGTGLSRLNKSDSQWLQTTGRLANGLQFNAVTRDADLGQRPSFATATGIDGTWAVGVNDGGDTTTTANAVLQRTVGSMKFSGKSSDTEVYNAIAQSRMAAGVLALTSTISATGAGPVRSLDIDFNDMTDPQLSGGGTDDSKFISANLNTISTYAYQAVLLGYITTVKAPNATALANYEAANPGLTDAQAWAQMSSFDQSNLSSGVVTGIKGDTTGDVAAFLANLLNAQKSYASLTSVNDPADAFLVNSYLLPNMLANSRDPSTGVISDNPNYDSSAFAKASAIYASKFNADASTSFGKDIETSGSSSNYGSATTGGQSPSNFHGNIPITSLNADGSTAADGTLAPAGNWLFGNFNQNGVRDMSAVESGLAAAKALYNVEPTGTTAPNSAFNVSSGTPNAANSTSVTYTDVNGTSHTMTKGDLIVMGDYLSMGKFDGASLKALATGAAASDASGSGYTSGTISGGQANFADTLRSAVLRKNDALNYMQANTADGSAASVFLRLSGRASLTAPGVTTAAGVPRNAIALNITDPNSGLEEFTYDSDGSITFDKHDVNDDGVVDFNDAVLVDQFNDDSSSNLTQQLAATEQTPVTGVVKSISLTYVQQIDNESTIGAADLAELNTGLTGTGNTNWYGYSIQKSGPGTISWNRTGGTVTVYTGAALQISSGTIHVTSAIDPFTDTATQNSIAISVANGAKLQYTGQAASGVQLDRLATLNISTGGNVSLDPNTLGGRSLLIIGSLTLAGKVDVGNNDLDIQGGSSLAALSSQAALGLAGNWNNSSGINSVSAASNHLTAVGIIQNNQGGSALFTASHPFDGTTPGTSDILAKYTYYGDANLSGNVDASDYSLIDSGFITHATGWFNGDFNYDGIINGSDYTLIDNAFNTQGAAITSSLANPLASIAAEIANSSSVPEPTTALMMIPALAIISRRRQRTQKTGKPSVC